MQKDHAPFAAVGVHELFETAAEPPVDREIDRITAVEPAPPAVVTVGGLHAVNGFDPVGNAQEVGVIIGKGTCFVLGGSVRVIHAAVFAECFIADHLHHAVEHPVEIGIVPALFDEGHVPRLFRRPFTVLLGQPPEAGVADIGEYEFMVGGIGFAGEGPVTVLPVYPDRSVRAGTAVIDRREFHVAGRILRIEEQRAIIDPEAEQHHAEVTGAAVAEVAEILFEIAPDPLPARDESPTVAAFGKTAEIREIDLLDRLAEPVREGVSETEFSGGGGGDPDSEDGTVFRERITPHRAFHAVTRLDGECRGGLRSIVAFRRSARRREAPPGGAGFLPVGDQQPAGALVVHRQRQTGGGDLKFQLVAADLHGVAGLPDIRAVFGGGSEGAEAVAGVIPDSPGRIGGSADAETAGGEFQGAGAFQRREPPAVGEHLHMLIVITDGEAVQLSRTDAALPLMEYAPAGAEKDHLHGAVGFTHQRKVVRFPVAAAELEDDLRRLAGSEAPVRDDPAEYGAFRGESGRIGSGAQYAVFIQLERAEIQIAPGRDFAALGGPVRVELKYRRGGRAQHTAEQKHG